MLLDGFSFIEETNWNNVFSRWQAGEGSYEDWQEVAKGKGWKDWEEWRSRWVENFKVSNRTWFRYHINDPLRTIPGFRVAPAKSWQEHFPPAEKNQHCFRSLVERTSFFDTDDKVQSFMKDFPANSEFIGIVMPDKSIVLLEGHHRATAISSSLKNGTPIHIPDLPTIALSFFAEGEEALLDVALEKGSANISQVN